MMQGGQQMRWWINGMLLIILLVLIIPSLIVKGCSTDEHRTMVMEPEVEIESDLLSIDIETLGNEPSIFVYDHVDKKTIDIPLEQYIVGVVAAEMPASFDIEALKAQAVAARTLAVRKMRAYGGRGCSKYENEADICTFYGHCQAWISDEEQQKNWRDEYKVNKKKIVQAVEDTRGLILTYQGNPIEVFFYSTSNGKTEDVSEVFSAQLPYYKVVDSMGEEDAPKFREVFTFTRREFIDIFKRQYPKGKLTEKNLESQVKIISHTESGRVGEISVGGIKLKGKDFRGIYGLNSADFKLEYLPDKVLIHTVGYGHGVGMSQVGADRMAKDGGTFEDILKHYYIGIDIDTAY